MKEETCYVPLMDQTEHLCAVDFERKRPYALAYIQATFEPSKTEWLDCYHVKQKITEHVGYFFAKDMAKYFALEGYEIKLTKYGYKVRAAYLREDKEPWPDLFLVRTEAICPGFREATPENP